jgi:hypothetical protein
VGRASATGAAINVTTSTATVSNAGLLSTVIPASSFGRAPTRADCIGMEGTNLSVRVMVGRQRIGGNGETGQSLPSSPKPPNSCATDANNSSGRWLS